VGYEEYPEEVRWYLERLDREIKALEDEIRRIRETLESIRRTIEEINRRIRRHEEIMRKLIEERGRIAEEIRKLRKERRKLRRRKKPPIERIEEITRRINELRILRRRITGRISYRRRRIRELTARRSELERRLEEETKRVERERVRIARELAEKEEERKKIETELSDLVRVDVEATDYPPALERLGKDFCEGKKVLETYANVRKISDKKNPYPYAYVWVYTETRRKRDEPRAVDIDLIIGMMTTTMKARREPVRIDETVKKMWRPTRVSYFDFYFRRGRLRIEPIPSWDMPLIIKWHYIEKGKERPPVYFSVEHFYVKRDIYEKKPYWSMHLCGQVFSVLTTLRFWAYVRGEIVLLYLIDRRSFTRFRRRLEEAELGLITSEIGV